jgi:MoaA/NifB/PqqE/SkfB family radical SAM enzyme
MCKDWKTPAGASELTLEEIKKVYSSPLFSRLQRIGFSGGEPTLRSDLAQVADTVLSCCPGVREIGLVTNGLEPDLVIKRVRELLDLCGRKGIRQLALSVSLDGYGRVHQDIRRVPQAFERVSETLRNLKALQTKRPFYLSSTCVVQRLNIESLVQLAEYTSNLRVPLTFVPVRMPPSSVDEQAVSPEIPADQIEHLKAIFDNQLRRYLVPSNNMFWQQYFDMHMNNKLRRSLPCYLLRHFAEIDTDGTLRICVQRHSFAFGNIKEQTPEKMWYSSTVKALRKRAEESICSGCADCCDLDTSLRQEFFFYAGFWLKNKIRGLYPKRSE